MPTASPNSSRNSAVAWGAALAAVSLMTIGGGAFIWSLIEPAATPPAVPSPLPDQPPSHSVSTEARMVHVPVHATPAAGVHAVAFAVENGTRVVKIKVVPDGDELIVDAATGRLLETRPNRPTAAPPMGKFAAPFAPMT